MKFKSNVARVFFNDSSLNYYISLHDKLFKTIEFMVSNEIAHLLKTNEEKLKALFTSQPTAFWEKKPEGKWSAGQHVIHLVQSTAPLLKALRLPKFLLKLRFGKSSRLSRDYNEVTQRYEEKLAAAGPGVVGPFSRNMPESTSSESEEWFLKLSKLNRNINKVTLNLSDKELDSILLPHPLMGKMTLREILMWNIHHTHHHIDILNKKYLN